MKTTGSSRDSLLERARAQALEFEHARKDPRFIHVIEALVGQGLLFAPDIVPEGDGGKPRQMVGARVALEDLLWAGGVEARVLEVLPALLCVRPDLVRGAERMPDDLERAVDAVCFGREHNNPVNLVDPTGLFSEDPSTGTWVADPGDTLESIAATTGLNLGGLAYRNPGYVDQTLGGGEPLDFGDFDPHSLSPSGVRGNQVAASESAARTEEATGHTDDEGNFVPGTDAVESTMAPWDAVSPAAAVGRADAFARAVARAGGIGASLRGPSRGPGGLAQGGQLAQVLPSLGIFLPIRRRRRS